MTLVSLTHAPASAGPAQGNCIMKRLIIPCVALLLALIMLPAHALLRGGLSGAWYDPSAPGHGISIEILEGQRALVFWSVFDPQGAPLTLYVESRIEGDSIIGTAYAPRGMRFGRFDRRELHAPVWGKVRIDFSSCDSARLSYDADGEAGGATFGAGTIDLRRLTRIAGTTCTLAAGNALPVGLYRVEFRNSGCGTSETPLGSGAVDAEGRLWAIQRWEPDWLGGTLPVQTSDGFNGCPPMTVAGRYSPGEGDSGSVVLDVSRSSYYVGGYAQRASIATGTRAPGRLPISIVAAAVGRAGVASVSFHRPDAVADDLSRDVKFAEVVGIYRAALSWQFSGTFGGHGSVQLTVKPNGDLCWDEDVRGSCVVAGALQESVTSPGFFDFSIVKQQTIYTGRAWLQPSGYPGQPELILVGDDPAQHAFGMILRRSSN
jgi:hypothetical protein